MTTYIGIDPGKTGAIAIWLPDGTAYHVPMPANDVDLCALFRNRGQAYAAVEKVSARQGQGIASAFTFGAQYGRVLCAVSGAGVRLLPPVTPKAWQQVAGCTVSTRRRKADMAKADLSAHKREVKAKAYERAKALFPRSEITLGSADAYCIAYYCRRTIVKQAAKVRYVAV